MSLSGQHIADIPSYIFGQNSSLYLPLEQSEMINSGGEISYIFMAVIIAATALYLLWINYWSSRGSNHKRLFGFLGYHRGDYGAKLEVISSPLFRQYIWSGSLVSLISFWIIAISMLELMPIYFLKQATMILFGIVAVFCYKYLAINLLGIILDTREFAKTIINVRGITYTMTAVFVTPIVFCLSLAKNDARDIFTYIIISQLIILLAIFIYETFLLFLSKKVSLLHTILYLCSVEIFPITLIWGFFNR